MSVTLTSDTAAMVLTKVPAAPNSAGDIQAMVLVNAQDYVPPFSLVDDLVAMVLTKVAMNQPQGVGPLVAMVLCAKGEKVPAPPTGAFLQTRIY